MPFFLNPLFLTAIAAAGIPVVLHLLSQRNPKPFEFSSLRFLQLAIAKSRRSRRLNQILILLMRALVLLLLALAFAQPRARSLHFLPEGPRTLVLVLDGSCSMRTRDGAVSNFDKARSWTMELMRSLNDRDRIAVLMTGVDSPEIIFPPISNHAMVRRAINDLEPGYGQVNNAAEVAAFLRKSADAFGNESIEFHVFSDFQVSSWKSDDMRELGSLARKSEIRLFLNRTAAPKVGNAWVRHAEVDVAPGDRSIAARAQVGAEDTAGGNSVLRLLVEGRELAQKGVVLQAGRSKREQLHAANHDANTFILGRVQLDSDPMVEDNSSFFAVKVQDQVPVLLVNGGAGETGARPDAFYLDRALNPQRKQSPIIRAKQVDWAQLNTLDLNGFQAVFIANPPAIADAVALKLELYAKSGGTVIFYPGSRNGLQRGVPGIAALAGLRAELLQHDTTQRFFCVPDDTAPQLERQILGILGGKLQFSGNRRLLLKSNEDRGRGYFRMDSGTPMLMQFPLENGEIWLCALAADRQWSEWPMHPSFVLFHQILCMQSATRQLKTAQIDVGSAAPLSYGGDALQLDVSIYPPVGGQQRVTLERRDKSQRFIVQQFSMPGHYRLELGTKQPEIRYVAVNVPAAESEMTFLDDGELKSHSAPAEVFCSASFDEQKRTLDSMTYGYALWPWLLLLAFLLAIAEELVANVRSWGKAAPSSLKDLINRRAS